MSKHKCGTCRYFQEARLAGSGWCHHPQRKTTSDLLIMVRKNELACRDEWSHDLWEPRTEAGSLAAPIAEPYAHHKMPPATEHEIAAVVLADRSLNPGEPNPASAADDVLLSELGVSADSSAYAASRDPIRSWAAAAGRQVEPGAPATPVVNTGTRNAIIRAREAYRERVRLESARNAELARLSDSAVQDVGAAPEQPIDATASHASGLDSQDDRLIEHPTPLPANKAELAETVKARNVSPVAGAGQESSDASRTVAGPETVIAPVDAAGEESHRPKQDDQAAEAETSLDDRWSRRFDETERGQAGADESDLLGAHPPTAKSAAASTFSVPSGPAFDTAYLDWYNDEPETTSSTYGESAAAVRLVASSDSAQLASSPAETDDVGYDNNEPGGIDDDGRLAAELTDLDLPEEFGDRHVDTDVEIHHVVVDDDLLQHLPGYELASHLPRVCRTCRDFRPAETGDRGWCANRWAFSHRRVVAGDEQTPCESALGNWWLPVDEVWSDAADVSSHGQPTPLLDAWLPHHRGTEPARRRS